MRSITLVVTILCFQALFTLGVEGKEKRTKLRIGDEAPTFVGLTDNNEKWDSAKQVGKHIFVVYFYPADMTGGCTKQACSYRDALADFGRKDVQVIGVSGDSVENHQVFKREHKLNFTLLADSDGKIAKAFGVETSKGGSIERLIDGKNLTLTRGITARRWTFVIDKEWRIAHVDTSVNAAKDSEKVMRVIEKLK